MKKAFTLAEIMIVSMVIGILTAILLPSARNAIPNEDVMKFKNAHNVLYAAIRELVNSDKYYLGGDLGVKPDSTLIDGTHTGDVTYLCQTLSDVLNIKSVNCSSAVVNNETMQIVQLGTEGGVLLGELASIKVGIDDICFRQATTIKKEIKLQNGAIIYQSAPNTTFGITNALHSASNGGGLMDNNRLFTYHLNDDGFYRIYKVLCVDFDTISPKSNGTTTCGNECPFGYALRVDWKIVNGARADEWLEKSVQEK